MDRSAQKRMRVLRRALRKKGLELRDDSVNCVVQGLEYRALPDAVYGKHRVDGIRLEADIEGILLVVDSAEPLN